jgi:hypothetical protein
MRQSMMVSAAADGRVVTTAVATRATANSMGVLFIVGPSTSS